MTNFNKCIETSPDLGYSSLQLDEEARAKRTVSFPKEKRFTKKCINGNLKTVFAEVDDDEFRKQLPRPWQTDTPTQTVFRDEFYKTHVTISDRVQSPNLLHSSVMAVEGHDNCSQFAHEDTRVLHYRAAYSEPLGPGSYDPDPLGERFEVGPLKIGPGEEYHGINYARDPTRESATFLSPERGRTLRDIRKAQAMPPPTSVVRGLDFADWTNRRCSMPHSERNIESERWGPNLRERKPPAEDRCQSVYSADVCVDGRAASTDSYSRSADSPAYAAPFNSGLPRLVGLPTTAHPDTRLWMRSSALMSTTGRAVGPGTYTLEPPRLRSWNANYQDSAVYQSLASSNPWDSPKDQSPLRAAQLAARGAVQGGTQGFDTHSQRPASHEWHPTGPVHRRGVTEGVVWSAPSSPPRPRSSPVTSEPQPGPRTPQIRAQHLQQPDAAPYDRAVVAAAVVVAPNRVHSHLDSSTGPSMDESYPAPGPREALGGSRSEGRLGSPGSILAAEKSSIGLAAAIREAIREQLYTIRSAPSTPTGARHSNQLVFSRPLVPHRSHAKTRLRVADDIKREREQHFGGKRS